MLVKCISNKLDGLTSAPQIERDLIVSTLGSLSRFPLIIGKVYVVYGISYRGSLPWYFVRDESECLYPILRSSLLFDIIDGTPSRFWRLDPGRFEHYELTVYPRFVLPNWASDVDYYDMLAEGEENRVKEFERYKQLMDIEFPNPTIDKTHTLLDGKWILCTKCHEAWEQSATFGLSVCPTCGLISNNPIYDLNTC